jgi:eukaryotic-like serine/threonine-protein kinase
MVHVYRNPSMATLAEKLQPLADQYASARGGAIEKVLGAGGSAAVYLLKVGETLSALKVYDPRFFDDKNGPAERRRIELQRQLQGHACISLIGFSAVEEAHDTCFLEMEYAPWPTLKDIIAQVPDALVAPLIGQLVTAVRLLEAKGLVHRDIKPENILVRPDFEALKLIDLGVAREMQGDEDAVDATDHSGRRPFIATAQYSSPEYLFRLQAPSPQLWQALTIYQLGGVLHDLVMKRPLFHEAVLTGNKFNVAAAVLRQVPSSMASRHNFCRWPFSLATVSSRTGSCACA